MRIYSYTNKASKINTGNNPLLFFGLSGISMVFPVIRVFPVSPFSGIFYSILFYSTSCSDRWDALHYGMYRTCQGRHRTENKFAGKFCQVSFGKVKEMKIQKVNEEKQS